MKFVRQLLQRRSTIVTLSWLLYIPGFIGAYSWAGRATPSLAVLPILISAGMTGVYGGLLAAVFSFPANALLLNLMGEPGWEIMTHGGFLGSALVLLVGILVGRLYDMSNRIKIELLARRQTEIAHQESEAQFRTLFEQSPHPVFLLTTAIPPVIRESNSAAHHLYGYSSEELTGKPISILDNQADIEKIPQRLTSLLNKGRISFDAAHQRKDGTRLVIEVRANLIEMGGQQFILATHADITEREKSKEALRRGNEKLAALYESSLDIIAPHEPQALLETIVKRATLLLDGSSGGMYLCDPQRREVRCVVSYKTPEDHTGTVFNYGQGSAGFVAETGKTLIIDDYRAWQGRAEAYEGAQPFVALVSAPMIWQDQVAGVIHVLHNEVGYFSAKHLELLTLFANQAALAVENAKLLTSAHQHAETVAALLRLSENIGATLDLSETLDLIIEAARNLLHLDRVAIFLRNKDEKTLVPVLPQAGARAQLKLDSQQSERFSQLRLHPNEVPLIKKMMDTRLPVAVNDATQSSLIPPEWAQFFGIRSLLVAPLLVGDEFLGGIYGDYNSESHSFSPSEVELVSGLARQAALAIERARLFDAMERHAQEQQTLRDAGANVANALQQKDAVKRVLVEINRIVPHDTATVQLLREDFLEIIDQRGWGKTKGIIGMRMPIPGQNPNTIVIQEQRHLIINDPSSKYASFQKFPLSEIRSWLGVPLIAHGQTIGMLTLDSLEAHHFTEQHVHLATIFANQVAVTIENARLFEEVQELAVTDVLTGIPNRRQLFDLGNREFNRAARFKRELSAIMLDIDHFKRVNDNFGHPIGDEVLQTIAQRCSQKLRDIDIFGRYGGEEFAILLPETPLAGAYNLAERLRCAVADHPIETGVGPLKITVSLGVASITNQAKHLSDLLGQADIALYAAKQSGRNRVVSRE